MVRSQRNLCLKSLLSVKMVLTVCSRRHLRPKSVLMVKIMLLVFQFDLDAR